MKVTGMGDWVVGVDLGGTKIELGLVDPADRIVRRQRIPTRADLGPRAVVERIAASVLGLSAALPAGERISALGICSPGPVDHRNGMIVDPPNLLGLQHTPLRDLLAERLGLPVQLEHDARAAALGEFHFGAGRGQNSMVYIVIGTGVGAAIILDGQLYYGEHGYAGEFGHMTLDPHGERCSCGSKGCVETFMSGPWLARRYQRALAGVNGQVSADPDETPVSGERVARLAAQGDALAGRVLADAGEALGIAVASLAMILNIDLYVVGGSVAKAGELLLEPARRAVPAHSHRSVASGVRLVATSLGDEGPILGCSWLARQALAV
jgi:glucokinase